MIRIQKVLWWRNNYHDPPDVYVMQVHIFGAASSPCIANSTLLRVTNDHDEDFNSSVAAVKDNFYVDDALPSANDQEICSHQIPRRSLRQFLVTQELGRSLILI